MRIGRFNLSRKPSISPEEEEDRARLLLSRRRFLFLGGAAAGALATKPLWPMADMSVHTYLCGKDAVVVGNYADYISIAAFEIPLRSLTLYYNKKFIENLAYNVGLSALAKRVELPQMEGQCTITTTTF